MDPVTRWRLVLRHLQAQYHRREFTDKDPIRFLYAFPDPSDREIVGLVTSAFAFGRVQSILNTVDLVLHRLGPAPGKYVDGATDRQLQRNFAGLRHRWSTGEELAALLGAARELRRTHGSLSQSLARRVKEADETLAPGLGEWMCDWRACGAGTNNSLLSDPAKGSACKRLFLYFRWMVREDEIDPGGWTGMSPAQLVVPVDVHLFNIARILGLTRRRQPNLKAALDITSSLRRVSPDDPTQYDFSLTRPGIFASEDVQQIRRKIRELSLGPGR